MDLPISANTNVTDDVVSAPSLDVVGVGTSALVHLAIGLIRVSALAGLASPLLLIAWVFL
jgi:hypothetical protein